jgi:hypothetical protein
MLVPVSGGVAALQKRNRSYPMQRAMNASIQMPQVYIFNVGLDPWKGVGGGKEWVIPARKKGTRFGGPVAVPMFNLSEIDIADGGNNMSTVTDRALAGEVDLGDRVVSVPGVVNDILGESSGSADLELYTTNGRWKGVFYSMSEEPSDEEIERAEECYREYMMMFYTEGKQRVEQNMKESENSSLRMQERKMFNRAASYLGYQPLYGQGEMKRGECPECKGSINEGANICVHCKSDITPTAIAAREKKREKEAAKLAKEEEAAEN